MTSELADGPSQRPLRVALSVYRGNPYCGGQGVYVRHLADGLARLGHHVTVFAGQPYPELTDAVELVKVPSLDLYRHSDPFRFPRLREFERPIDLVELATMWCGGFPEPRTFSRRFREELRRRRGDFDIVHDDQSLGSALLDLEADGLSVIASIHHPVTIDRALELAEAGSAAKRRSIERWYRFSTMQSRVAGNLRRLLTVSQSAKSDIVREMGIDPSRIAVVPVGVDTSVWHPYPTVRRVSGRIMTTASADVPLKGLAVLLEAIAKLRTERDDVHLVVIGRLEPTGKTAALIERLGIDDAVQFVAGESDSELARRYASSELAVVPSLYEGFSLPAIEAMACGVPLVVTNGGALPEVVGEAGVAAVVVTAGEPDQLCSAIGALLDDRALATRIGEAGRVRVSDRFTWSATAIATAFEYRRALGDVQC